MKKILFLILFLFAGAVPASAQSGVCTGYQPLANETLWGLAERNFGDPMVWQQQIWDKNPQIHGAGRRYTDSQKRDIVRIYLGDCLQGLTPQGKLIPASVASTPVVQPPAVVQPSWYSQIPSWVWGLVALLLLALAFLGWREIKKDPATSGEPIVPGGVNEQTARDRFQQMAANAHRARTGQSLVAQNFQIRHQVAGRMDGLMMVSYANGSRRPRLMANEPAFRATVQFPDGSQEDLYMLQRCGNDLRYGGIHRYVPGLGFRFTPDAEAPAAPAPAPAPAGVATPIGDKAVHIELVPADGQHETSMLRAKGVDPNRISYSVDHDGTATIRFIPQPAAAPV